MIVCLPKVDVKGMRWPSDTTWRDTVFINHDSMKVAGDVPVFLVIKDDATGKEINLKEKIDSVGYRYRSFWIANENLPPDTANQKSYPRIFRNDSSYVRWTNAFPTNSKTCLVKLDHDSLYAIGGKLTIEALGALEHVNNINNIFVINSDSIAPNGDTIRHKILIDADPSNAEFSVRLGTDRIRAVAWQEYAGSADSANHCDLPPNVFNPQWNHYWDMRISARDTCRDSLMPCENRTGFDTGIMQIYRKGVGWSWESHFERSGSKPSGYTRVKWDSLAWSWKICIDNGRYIHDTYMPKKFTLVQKRFPDSCAYSDCDTFPKSKNQEDLKALGYHSGENFMNEVIDDTTWVTHIARTKTPILEYCKYVQNVRKFYYRKPWR